MPGSMARTVPCPQVTLPLVGVPFQETWASTAFPAGCRAPVWMVTGGRIWKLSAFEVPPPGAGVVTATETLEAVVRLLVGIVAVKVEAFVTAVGSADPAQRICEPEDEPCPGDR